MFLLPRHILHSLSWGSPPPERPTAIYTNCINLCALQPLESHKDGIFRFSLPCFGVKYSGVLHHAVSNPGQICPHKNTIQFSSARSVWTEITKKLQPDTPARTEFFSLLTFSDSWDRVKPIWGPSKVGSAGSELKRTVQSKLLKEATRSRPTSYLMLLFIPSI